MSEQTEFDFVGPDLAGIDPYEQRLLEEALALQGHATQKRLMAKIYTELRQQESIIAPQPSTELNDLRLLLGEQAWVKSRRRWERRLKRNVVSVRRVIIVLRNLFNS